MHHILEEQEKAMWEIRKANPRNYDWLVDFLCASNLAVAEAVLKMVEERIAKLPVVLIGDKLVRVDSIQKAVDAEDHEYLDTCKISTALSEIKKQISEMR